MKPYKHAVVSANRWGGVPEDYQELHDFFDMTKQNVPDMRHRMILHNSFGIFLLEKMFGKTITNSHGRIVSVRDVGEQHVIEDLGFIPTLEKCFSSMKLEKWMGGQVGKSYKISLVDEKENYD